MSEVSPEYHTSSPVFTTAVASLLSITVTFERLSNVSCPLTASIGQLPPRRMATLTRSQPISRRPSLAIVYAVWRTSSFSWAVRVNVSSCSHSVCFSDRWRSRRAFKKSPANSHTCSRNRR